MRELTYIETLATSGGITKGAAIVGATTAVVATSGLLLSDTTGDSNYGISTWLFTGLSLGLIAGGIIDKDPCLAISGLVCSLFSGVMWYSGKLYSSMNWDALAAQL